MNEKERKKKKKVIIKKKMRKEKKYMSMYHIIIKLCELLGSLKCIRNFKASRLKDPHSFSNHVQSDNEDFLCASGLLFAICTCPPISSFLFFSFSP
jgi:hypothetical protein